MKKITLLAAILCLLTIFLIIGCDVEEVEDTTDDPNNNQGQDTYTLEVSTSWPEGMFLHEIPLHWAEEVEKASGGRLEVEVHPEGAVVGGAEVLDAAHMGSIDAYHSATNLWIGKMPAAPFFCSYPMTFEPTMHLGWTYEGGGLELWQQMYDEEGYDVKVIPMGFTGPELLAWSNERIETLDDWVGLKYRTAAWFAEILREMDVSVTTLPPGELYQALDRGVLDALQFATANIDRDLGFYELAEYMTGPGANQPTVMYYMGINKDVWNSLPEDLQYLIEATAKSTTMWSYTYDLEQSMQAREFYLEEGVEPIKADEEVQLEIQELTWEFLDREAEEYGGIYAETWDSIQEYRKRYIEFDEFYRPIRGNK